MKLNLKFTDLDHRLAKRIYKDLLALNPQHTKPNFDKWAHELRLLREQKYNSKDSKADLLNIFQVWSWANKHDFWKTNILSPAKLRKQYDALLIQKTAAERKQIVGKKHKACRECGRLIGLEVSSSVKLSDDVDISRAKMQGDPNICIECFARQ